MSTIEELKAKLEWYQLCREEYDSDIVALMELTIKALEEHQDSICRVSNELGEHLNS